MNRIPRHIPTSLGGARRAIRRPARAFTMLEIMLAVVLGALVLTTALGVFATLQRSSRYNEERLRNAMDLSLTHRSVELALRSMILSNTRPPPPDGVTPGRPTPAPAEPDSPGRPRVILRSDPSLPLMRWVDSNGDTIEIDAQQLELTIERPPVFPEPQPGDNFAPVVHRMYASRRQRDRDERREEREAEREQLGPDESGDNPFDDTEPAIAAGVRGAFGLTWEPDRPRPGEPADPEGGSWTLWWRTLPPITDIPDTETTEGLSDEEIDTNPMYRPVKLATNLRWCKWEAVRDAETVSAFESTWWEDLPAFVTLEIRTVSGKWSKWMFEVQGTRGAEPGTPTGGVPAGQGAADAAAQQIDNLLEGADNAGAPPARTTPGRRGGK